MAVCIYRYIHTTALGLQASMLGEEQEFRMAWIMWNICKQLNFDIKENQQALISSSITHTAHVLPTEFFLRKTIGEKKFAW